jgi:hypothetical protein
MTTSGRTARTWRKPTQRIERRTLGFLDEPHANPLELNLALHQSARSNAISFLVITGKRDSHHCRRTDLVLH